MSGASVSNRLLEAVSFCQLRTRTFFMGAQCIFAVIFRFVFHDNSSSKLDNRVEFPLAGLCLQPYVDSGEVSNNSDDSSDDYMYDLYGLVCHFGSMSFSQSYRKCGIFLTFFSLVGASSGHYTAYTKHVNSKDWHYYNDETVLSRAPQDEDFSHGYVLFYQRRGRSSSCHDEVLVTPSVLEK